MNVVRAFDIPVRTDALQARMSSGGTTMTGLGGASTRGAMSGGTWSGGTGGMMGTGPVTRVEDVGGDVSVYCVICYCECLYRALLDH